jgi:hypothetical protein
MNEEERARKLSDAIDALLRGEESDMALDDQELVELLRIARMRHQAGQALADVGLTYQELLRRVLQARIVARQIEESGEKADDAAPEVSGIMNEDPEEFLDPLDPGYGKLINLLDFRPKPAQPAPVIQATATKTKPRTCTLIAHWSRRSDHSSKKVEALSAALDSLVSSRKRTVSEGDPDIDELMQVAQLRRFVGESLAAAGSPYKRRLWTVLRMRLASSLRRQAYAPRRPALIAAFGRLSWQHAAAAAAAIALLAATLGPLPATGFADHPVTHLLGFVRGHVGVEEVDGPPPTEVPVTASETPIAPEQAADLLGLTVRQPFYLPDGFQLARSSYYPQSPSSPEQATFLLTYTVGGVDPDTLDETKDPYLFIYQQRASSDSVAVMDGQAEDVVLAGGVPATYAGALWTAGDQGTLEGTSHNAESLLFEDDGVLVIITYKNGHGEKQELVRIAESMLDQ